MLLWKSDWFAFGYLINFRNLGKISIVLKIIMYDLCQLVERHQVIKKDYSSLSVLWQLLSLPHQQNPQGFIYWMHSLDYQPLHKFVKVFRLCYVISTKYLVKLGVRLKLMVPLSKLTIPFFVKNHLVLGKVLSDYCS